MARLQKLTVGVVCSLVLLSVVAPMSGVAAAQADDGPSVGTVSVTDSVSVWERAPLPLRTDPGGPTQVEGMSLFFNAPQQNTGDVPLNKPTLSVYDTGEPITMDFRSSLGAGTESFAGEDAQLIAVRLENESSMQRFTGGFSPSAVGDLVASDADDVSVEVLDDEAGVGAIDENGELNVSYTPEESGGYVFMVATVDSGDGFVAEGDDLNAANDVTVVGMDTALVHDAESDVKPDSAQVAPGDDVSFQVQSNVDGEDVTHGVVVYRKAELVSQRATATLEGDLDRNLSTDQLTVETTLDRVEGTSDVQDDATLLGVNLGDDRFNLPMTLDGLFDVVATETQNGQGQEDVLHASMTVVEAGPDGTVTVQTGEDWPNGNYRFVHVATAENGSQISTSDGRITVNPGGGQGDSGQDDDEHGTGGQGQGNGGQSGGAHGTGE